MHTNVSPRAIERVRGHMDAAREKTIHETPFDRHTLGRGAGKARDGTGGTRGRGPAGPVRWGGAYSDALGTKVRATGGASPPPCLLPNDGLLSLVTPFSL